VIGEIDGIAAAAVFWPPTGLKPWLAAECSVLHDHRRTEEESTSMTKQELLAALEPLADDATVQVMVDIEGEEVLVPIEEVGIAEDEEEEVSFGVLHVSVEESE
jgi:hypothetical protein